jgi:hypothetical protein
LVLFAAFCAVAPLSVGGATRHGSLRWGCSAQQNELCIGKFDGHGCTLRVLDWGLANPGPSPTRAPDRRDRRGEGFAGQRLCAAVISTHTRSFSNRMPVLSSLSGHEVNDIASSGRATPRPSCRCSGRTAGGAQIVTHSYAAWLRLGRCDISVFWIPISPVETPASKGE